MRPLEREIVRRILAGEQYADIARALHYSPSMIHNSMARLRERFECVNNEQLIAALARSGQLPDEVSTLP